MHDQRRRKVIAGEDHWESFKVRQISIVGYTHNTLGTIEIEKDQVDLVTRDLAPIVDAQEDVVLVELFVHSC